MAERPLSLNYLFGNPDYDPADMGVRAKGAAFDLNADVYNRLDRFLLLEHFARTSEIGYVNLPNLTFKYPEPEQSDELDGEMAYLLTQSAGGTAILDGARCISNSEADSANIYVTAQTLGLVAHIYPDSMPKRIVMPITLGLPEENEQTCTHLGIIVLDFDPSVGDRGHFTISCFEPIGHTDGQADDYGKLWEHIGDTMGKGFADYGFTSGAMRNIVPYYEGKRNVCQNVGIEAVKTLCMSEEPIDHYLFGLSELYMSDSDVDEKHRFNMRLLQRFEQIDASQAGEIER